MENPQLKEILDVLSEKDQNEVSVPEQSHPETKKEMVPKENTNSKKASSVGIDVGYESANIEKELDDSKDIDINVPCVKTDKKKLSSLALQTGPSNRQSKDGNIKQNKDSKENENDVTKENKENSDKYGIHSKISGVTNQEEGNGQPNCNEKSALRDDKTRLTIEMKELRQSNENNEKLTVFIPSCKEDLTEENSATFWSRINKLSMTSPDSTDTLPCKPVTSPSPHPTISSQKLETVHCDKKLGTRGIHFLVR
jgi:hypothetical protein